MPGNTPQPTQTPAAAPAPATALKKGTYKKVNRAKLVRDSVAKRGLINLFQINALRVTSVDTPESGGGTSGLHIASKAFEGAGFLNDLSNDDVDGRGASGWPARLLSGRTSCRCSQSDAGLENYGQYSKILYGMGFLRKRGSPVPALDKIAEKLGYNSKHNISIAARERKRASLWAPLTRTA